MKNLLKLSANKNVCVECIENFDFSKHSTIGTGGTAAFAFFPKTVKELIKLVDFLDEEGEPFIVLGKMSNILPPDVFFEKAIVFTTKLNNVEFSSGVFAEAGVSSSAFLRKCAENGKTGAEFLAGIPCTIGGAAYMNAGACGKYLSDIVKKVLVYKQKRLCLLPVNACGYGYKKSAFMEDDAIVLGVEFSLENGEEQDVLANVTSVLKSREWLPKGKSMGCVFKNPLGDSAGRLIDGAGLKGLRIGGAVVSDVHANFIINDKGATSSEIKKLISIIKNAVYAQYKIVLEEEIRIID